MIQDQPIQQSLGKELNSSAFRVCVLDLKYPQTAVCGIFARASLACRVLSRSVEVSTTTVACGSGLRFPIYS